MNIRSALSLLLLTSIAILTGCSSFSTGSGKSDLAMVSAQGGLTLRAKQSTSADKLDTVAFGETVEIISAGRAETIDSIKTNGIR